MMTTEERRLYSLLEELVELVHFHTCPMRREPFEDAIKTLKARIEKAKAQNELEELADSGGNWV